MTAELQSKYFGNVEYEEKDVIRFPAGLFGFDEEHAFLLLPFEGGGGSMLCLQSVATPALAFVVLDPFSLKPDYAPECALRREEPGICQYGELEMPSGDPSGDPGGPSGYHGALRNAASLG